jgi:hypothetical protein
VIPLLLALPLTVAVSFAVEFGLTVATAGDSVTEIWEGGGSVWILEEPPHPKLPAARKTDGRNRNSIMRFLEFITHRPSHSKKL